MWNTKKQNGRDRRTERRRADLRLREYARLDIDRAVLCKVYTEGAALGETAKAFGTTTQVVKRILMEEGIEIRAANRRALDEHQIIALHQAGFDTPSIAEELGCSATGARIVLLKAGFPLDRNTIDRSHVKAFYAQGLRPSEIAARVGCTSDSVRRILEELSASGKIAYQKRDVRPAAGHTPERDALIVRDFKTGQHSDHIAKAYGVSATYVLQQARKEGLKTKGGKLRALYTAAYCPENYQRKKRSSP